MIHMISMSMIDLMATSIEILRIDIRYCIKKELTELICINP